MRDLVNFPNCTRRKESFETESALEPGNFLTNAEVKFPCRIKTLMTQAGQYQFYISRVLNFRYKITIRSASVDGVNFDLN